MAKVGRTTGSEKDRKAADKGGEKPARKSRRRRPGKARPGGEGAFARTPVDRLGTGRNGAKGAASPPASRAGAAR